MFRSTSWWRSGSITRFRAITVGAAIEDFLLQLEEDKSPATLRWMRHMLTRFSGEFGKTKVGEVHAGMIRAYWWAMQFPYLWPKR